jgi:uncharacterized membrane protein YfcA
MDLPAGTVALLTAAAFVAGFVDAIAGGGGLITLPALMAAGLPPHLALGTNKGQSVWGSGAALLSFSRAGLVRWKQARITFPLALCGAAAGVAVLSQVPKESLRPVILALLVAVAVFLAFRPKFGQGHRGPMKDRPAAAAGIAFTIAAYDGFFGPGTGTFLILAFVILLGDSATEASADAKVVNFGSNLASCLLFAVEGKILWDVALPMAGAQLIGATLGAKTTARGGDALVRRIVMLVVVATCAKLAWDLRG